MADANFKPRNVLLIGATGLIGTHIARSIVSARAEFERVAIFTSPPTARSAKEAALSDLKSKNVEVIYGDITNEQDIAAAYKGIDTVISAVGRPAILLQIPLIKLAAASDSVKWFLPSEYGTDIKYGPASANEKPHQLKLKVRAYLEEDEAIRQSGLKYTYVVTGPYPESYMDFTSSAREAGGWDFDTKTTYLLEKNNRVSFTSQKDTGDLVLATLRHPAASFNKALKVNSFTTTPAEFHAEIERQTGGPWTVHDTSLARLREIEQEAWAAGIPAAGVVTLRRIWSDGGTLYDHRDNGVIGEPRVMTLKETVANHLKRRA